MDPSGNVANGEVISAAGNPSSGSSGSVQFGPPREYHFNDLTKRNKCYIICNRFERTPHSLKTQYELDVVNIGKTFSWLNFDVKVKRDLTYAKIDNLIRKICEQDHTHEESLVFFILSHGTEDRKVLGSDCHGYKIDSIVDKLQKVQTLQDKPKLIFIQACRGEEEMKTTSVMRAAGGEENIRVAEKSNMFVYYSTMQGNKAYCSTSYGSFFIHVLCGVMNEYYDNENMHIMRPRPRYHFGDVVTRVNDYLSTHVRDYKLRGEVEEKELVQVSESHSSLTQHLFFYPNPENYEKYMKENGY